MRRMILTMLALACAPLASASNNFGSGPLLPKFVTSKSDGTATVYFVATNNGTSTRNGAVPACATDNAGPFYQLAFKSNTPEGKSILAILLAAHAAGEGVFFLGSGDCGVIGTIESLQAVQTGT